jgi:hypothetical protein
MKIVHVTADDWDGIYIDGTLHFEGHCIPEEVWKDLIKRAFSTLGGWIETVRADEEELIEAGNYPKKIKDLKRA